MIHIVGFFIVRIFTKQNGSVPFQGLILLTFFRKYTDQSPLGGFGSVFLLLKNDYSNENHNERFINKGVNEYDKYKK